MQATQQPIDMDQARIKVKRRITEAGLTQRQFADRARVTPPTLSLWLRGASRLGKDKQGRSNLVKIGEAYDSLQPNAALASLLAAAELADETLATAS